MCKYYNDVLGPIGDGIISFAIELGTEGSRVVGVTFNVANGVLQGVLQYYGDPNPDEQQKIGEICTGQTLNAVFGLPLAEGVIAGVSVLALPEGLIAVGILGGGVILSKISAPIGQAIYNYFLDPVCVEVLEWWTGVGRYYDPNAGRGLFPCDAVDPLVPPRKYILEKARDLFRDAMDWLGFSPRSDPLVLGLDGDGIQTTNLRNGAFFDQSSDGFYELNAWVDPDDGMLVMDRNGNGIIDDGKELFGDQTILNSGAWACIPS